MITIQLFVEVSNQDCAVEVRDREIEIRDLLARVMEQSTFDELDTLPGKNRLKEQMRKSVNRILNKGRIHRIFFKHFSIQK